MGKSSYVAGTVGLVLVYVCMYMYIYIYEKKKIVFNFILMKKMIIIIKKIVKFS